MRDYSVLDSDEMADILSELPAKIPEQLPPALQDLERVEPTPPDQELKQLYTERTLLQTRLRRIEDEIRTKLLIHHPEALSP